MVNGGDDKSEEGFPDLPRLMQDAEKVNRSAPAFATVAYHLARLKIEQNKTVEARKLLDEIIVSDFASLPISAQILFSSYACASRQTSASF
jgi:hypothetical protein